MITTHIIVAGAADAARWYTEVLDEQAIQAVAEAGGADGDRQPPALLRRDH